MTDTLTLPLSQRLRKETHSTHDRLDQSIMAASPFATLQGYGRFACVQWAFHREIDALYDDAGLAALLPGLAERRRLDLIAADLADLGLALPAPDATPLFAPGAAFERARALGWLYVAEGSNLGAALLRKEAAKLGLSDRHGARHLAPAAEGPAPHWRQFTAALDGASLAEAEQDLAITGGREAFARVQALVEIWLG